MTIMPPPQSSVCEMPLNGAKDCVVVESLRCPYCLAAVEIRQGDNWVAYWCSQHGAVEPISFTDTALADGRISSPAFTCLSAGCLPPPGIPAGIPLPAGLFYRIFPDAPGRYEPFSAHESDNNVAGCIARGFEA